jgi:hypothetical protein
MKNGVVIVWLVLVTTGIGLGQDRDKSGTSTQQNNPPPQIALGNQGRTGAVPNGAEREGFEPSIPLRVYRFSRPTHSTTLPPLRMPACV